MKKTKSVLISGDFSIYDATTDNVETVDVCAKKGKVVRAAKDNKAEVADEIKPQPSVHSLKAEQRKEALRNAGVDVTNIFSMGEDMLVRVVDGVPSEITSDDPIYKKIMDGGTIPERRLFRRWVMAQMFRMLRQMETRNYTFAELLESNGYHYMFHMLKDEFRVQIKLAKTDQENFQKRNVFFNKESLVKTIEGDIANTRKYIDGLKIRHCKNKPYKKVGNMDIFTSDISKKVFRKLDAALEKLRKADSPSDIYDSLLAYDKVRVRVRDGFKMPNSFINAYKGAGAYFTMENLIRFHGCRFKGASLEERSLSFLSALAITHKDEGWRMLGVLKEFIAYNKISVEGKIKEWSK